MKKDKSNRIEKIIFINSATMNEETLKTDGVLLLDGTNNVGKSSIMRGVLYLQGNDANNMGYEKGIQFSNYYFPDMASYVVQQIRKADGSAYCLVHYNGGNTFVTGEYEMVLHDLIIAKDGNISTPKELTLKLKENKISHLNTNVGDARSIFYGNKGQNRISNADPYVFCDCGEKIISRLANTFLSKEIVGDDICKMLIDNKENNGQDDSFDLVSFREQSKDYSDKLQDLLVNWGTEENPGKVQTAMKEVADTYDKILEQEEKDSQLVSRMAYRHEQDVRIINESKSEIDRITQASKSLINEEENKVKGLDKSIKDMEFSIREWDKFEKSYKEYQEKYSTPEMKDAISKYERMDAIRDERETLDRQISQIESSANLDKEQMLTFLGKKLADITTQVKEKELERGNELGSQLKILRDNKDSETKSYIEESNIIEGKISEINKKLTELEIIRDGKEWIEHPKLIYVIGEEHRGLLEGIKKTKQLRDEESQNVALLRKQSEDNRAEHQRVQEKIDNIRQRIQKNANGLKENIKKEVTGMLSALPEVILNKIKEVLERILKVVDKWYENQEKEEHEEAENKAKQLNAENKKIKSRILQTETSLIRYDSQYGDYVAEIENIVKTVINRLQQQHSDCETEKAKIDACRHDENYWIQKENEIRSSVDANYQPVIDELKRKECSLIEEKRELEENFDRLIKEKIGEAKARELTKMQEERNRLQNDYNTAIDFRENYGSKYGSFIEQKKQYCQKSLDNDRNKQRIQALYLEKGIITKEFDSKKNELENKKSQLKGEITQLEETVKRIEAYRSDNLLMFTEKKEETTILLSIMLEEWKTGRKNMEELKKRLKEAITNNDRGLQEVLCSLDSYNLRKVKDSGDILKLMEFGRTVKNQIPQRDKYVASLKQRMYLSNENILNACIQFDDKIDNLKKEVARVNERLAECVKNISALDELQINVSKDIYANDIVRELYNIYEISQKYDLINGQETLLTPENYNKDEYFKSIRQLVNIVNSKDNEDKKVINLSDIVKVEFRSSENGNDSGWKNSINKTGSEGTGIIAKILLDISLIDIIRQKSKIPAKLNLVIDEIGKMDSSNFNEIIRYAESCGLNIFCGAPQVMDRSKFDYVYRVWKENNKTYTMLDAEHVKDEEDW